MAMGHLLTAILAAMLHGCNAWSWDSLTGNVNSWTGGNSVSGGSSLSTVTGGGLSNQLFSTVEPVVDSIEASKDSIGAWWIDNQASLEKCKQEYAEGIMPEGRWWSAGFRHVPAALQDYCATMVPRVNNTKYSLKYREWVSKRVDSLCKVETRVAYPGCIEWMPDDCLKVSYGEQVRSGVASSELKAECFEQAIINQECQELIPNTGCVEKTLKTSKMSELEDVHTEIMEVDSEVTKAALNRVKSVGNEQVKKVLATCERLDWVPIAGDLQDKCYQSAQLMVMYDNIFQNGYVDDRCPPGVEPTECYSYVQRTTGGVPKWVPYVAIAGAAAFIAAPATVGVAARFVTQCTTTCATVGWSAGKKSLSVALDAMIVAERVDSTAGLTR